MSDYIVKRLVELIRETPYSISKIAQKAGKSPPTFSVQYHKWATKDAQITSGTLIQVSEALGYGWVAVPHGYEIMLVPPGYRGYMEQISVNIFRKEET